MCPDENERKKLLKKICRTTTELYRRLEKTKDKKLREAYANFLKAQSDYDDYCEKNRLLP